MQNPMRWPQRLPIDDILFAALVLLHLVPVWAFRFIPTQDGPAHLGTANVIRLYSRPESEAFRKYFVLTRDLDPYWTVNLLLGRLLDAVPPLTAEKIFVSLFVILFPLSVRFLTTSIDRRQSYLSWLAFPLMMGFWFHMGFYNFCLGLALYCWALGLWLRQQVRASPAGLAALGLLSVVLYFTHPVPSVLLVLTVGLLSGWKIVREKSGMRCLRPSLVFLPFLALLGTFSWAALNQPARPVGPPPAASDAWRILSSFDALVSFPHTQVPLMGVMCLLLLVLSAVGVKKMATGGGPGHGGGHLMVFAVLLGLYFVMTTWHLMNRRLVVFIFLAAIAWLATVPFGERAAKGIRVVAFLLAALWAIDLTAQYRKLNPPLEEAASLADSVRPGSTLLYLPFAFPWKDDGIRFNPYRHFGNYVAVERNLVSLNNYEANLSFLPLTYRRGLNPYARIGDPEGQRPVNLGGFAQTGGSIDYVMMWIPRPENVPAATEASLRPQLDKGYDLIGVSAGRRAFLYRRKGFV